MNLPTKDATYKDPIGYRMVLTRHLIAWMKEKSTTNWVTCVGFISNKQTLRLLRCRKVENQNLDKK